MIPPHAAEAQRLAEQMRGGELVVDLFAGPGGSPDECWDNLGSDHGNGYRTIRINGSNAYLHRVSYEHHVGPIPDDLVIDHECRNRACWNPKHLKPKTNAVNILLGGSPPARNARKPVCPRCESEYSPDGKHRRCRPCRQSNRTDTKRPGIGRAAERSHCPQNHAYDEANTYLVRRRDGSIRQRVCRECSRQRVRARRAAKGGDAI